MADYTNNLRLKEIVTGDEDGTWGTSTNTNLDLIAEAFGYGTEQFAADANETFTMADGATDGIRPLYLKITSAGTLTATRTATLAPSTVSKVWIIENATTGAQTITIKQGSGGTVNIAAGKTKIVYSDGAGAGAAITEVSVLTDAAIASTIQAYSSKLTDIAALTATDGNFVVGNGTTWVAESGSTALTSLGLDTDLATFSVPASTTISAYGKTLVDDADAATAQATLGLGTMATKSTITLTTDVTGDLPLSNIAQASGANVLLGRGSAGGAGDFQEVTLGTGLSMSGTVLSASTGGGGDVTKVGTPVDSQIGVWTGDGTIEGDSALTFDTSTDTLAIAASGKLAFGAVNVLSDSAGTMTLSNVNALDATTEATIEAAIDTLSNLTSASSLATVGTITSGTWNGTVIATGYVASTLTGKTLTTATLTQPTLTLKQGTNPTPTAEGDIQWDTNDNRIVVGDGAAQKIFVPTASFSGDATVDTSGVVTLSATYLTDITGESINDLSDVVITGAVKGDIIVFNGTSWVDIAVGSDAQVLTADSTAGSGVKWATPAGGGDVTKVGTPVDGQIGVWTGSGTMEGDSALTFDTTTDSLVVAASGNLKFGAVTILADSAGTMTLSNINALDATTETTIENAIDTLSNLTTVGTITSGIWQSTKVGSSYVADTLDGKTLTTATITTPTLTLKQDIAPTPTAEGDIQWDTNDNKIIIGDGSGQKVFVPTASFSGDATVDTSGVVAISSGVIVNADINASAAIDATKIGGGSVDNTEFAYLNGVTSAIQTQIDAKQATLSGASLTAVTISASDKVLIQDADDSSNLKTVTTQAIADLGGGDYVLIKAVDASAVSSVDFLHGTSSVVLDSTYDEYVIRFMNVVPATDGTFLYVRTSTNASTFDSATADYYWCVTENGSAADTGSGVNQFQFVASAGGVEGTTRTTNGVSGELRIFRPSEAIPTMFSGYGTYDNDGASIDLRTVAFSGIKNTAEDVNGIQFLFSSGNVASGKFALYGIKRT